MTGYGTTSAQTKTLSLDVSLRAVNGRFLEVRFHLPREYMNIEGDLKKILSEKMRRGTVDVFINRKFTGAGKLKSVKVNHEIIPEYLGAYKEIAKKYKIPATIHLESFTKLPEVLLTEEGSEVSALEQKLVLKTFEKSLDACLKERSREGLSLQKTLLGILDQLQEQIETIISLREEANQNLKEKWDQKLAARAKDLALDPQRLAQEVVMQLEKSDINEELERLEEHFKNYRKILSSSDAEGKKLDFYTQELLREVNTIGSKSQVAKITQSVVEAKTLIERLREQVQNVE